MQRLFFSRLLLVICLAFLAGINWYCGKKNTVQETLSSYAGLSDSAEYVGMKECQQCHTGIHESFVHTGMGLSLDIATRQKSAADFSGHPVVYDQHRDLNYHPFWNGDSLQFLEFRMDGKDTVYQQKRTISYIVGSGQHTNSHMWEENGYVFQAPLTFYTQRKHWDMPPGFENGNNTRFNRIIAQECMTCHNAYPDYVAGSENKYTNVPNGIDCERCHGPGSIHVAQKRAGILVDTSKYIDYSIVNPAKLSADLHFDVCQRCHIQGNAVLKPGKSFFDFRPGMKLSDVMDVYMPVYSGSEDEHIMASHAERLKMSKCFSATMSRVREKPVTDNLRPYKDVLTCVTCHNPHVSVKATAQQHFKTICSSCHTGSPDPECALPLAERLKKQDDCVSCHMPMNNTTDIPHVSVHDHRIAVHVEKKSANAIREFAGINCINNQQPGNRSKAEAFINYAEKFELGPAMLDSALKYLSNPAQPGDDADLLVNVYYLKRDWKTVIAITEKSGSFDRGKYSLNDTRPSWTCYRIGEAYEQSGNSRSSSDWFRKAVEHAPLNPLFVNKLAGSLVKTGETESAFRMYANLVKEHPSFAPGHSNYGYLLLTVKNDAVLALKHYDQALALDPDYSQAVINKAGLFLFRGDKAGALRLLKQHLKHATGPDEIKKLIRRIENEV